MGYLINAYRNIEKAAFAFDPNAHKDNVESAIADIQLFGSLKQVRLAQEFSDRMSNETTADVRELLTDLRNELRKELGLESAGDKIVFFRLKELYKQGRVQ